MKWAVALLMLAGRVAAARCPPAGVFAPQVTFDDARRIVQLRVVQVDVRASSDEARCVDLELELIESFRAGGPEKIHDHLHVTVQQTTVRLHTDRPAGTWWTGEQVLMADRELVAFCPDAGELSTQLQARCTIHMAEPQVIGDLAFERDAEHARWDSATLLAKARAGCTNASYLLGHIVWKYAGKDLVAFTELTRLLEDPACASDARGTLLLNMYEAATVTDDVPRMRILVRAFFHLLALPAAADLHDAIVEPYLPNLLGLNGGKPALTAADVLDAGARKAARAALAGYGGPSNAAPLRAWLRP